jgi:hypothetical protein
VKDRETADAFRQLFVKCQSEYKKGAAPATAPGSAAAGGGDASVTPAPASADGGAGSAASAAAGGSGGLWSKVGTASTTWRCETCMVESPLDTMKCGACGTVKPGSVPSADEAKKAPAPASKFSFGGQAAAGGKAFSAKLPSAKVSEESDAAATAPAGGAAAAPRFGIQPAAATGKFSFGQPKAAATPAAAAPPAGTDAGAEPPKPKSSIFGGLKLTPPAAGAAGAKTLGATAASTPPAQSVGSPSGPASAGAVSSPSGSGGFAKKAGESGGGGFAALAKSGGGFAKSSSPGGKSIFDTKTKAVFGGAKAAGSPKADASAKADTNGNDDGDDDGGEGDGISADDGIRFEAVVKLTKVETSTGEEGWEELMSVPCKL